MMLFTNQKVTLGNLLVTLGNHVAIHSTGRFIALSAALAFSLAFSLSLAISSTLLTSSLAAPLYPSFTGNNGPSSSLFFASSIPCLYCGNHLSPSTSISSTICQISGGLHTAPTNGPSS